MRLSEQLEQFIHTIVKILQLFISIYIHYMSDLNLFNESNYQSLNTFFNKNAKEYASRYPSRKWNFYAMTCFFNQDIAKKMASDLVDLLGKNLVGFHVLIDKNEWVKQFICVDDFVDNICKITTLEKQQVSFIPINANGHLFHAKSYGLISLPSNVKTSNSKTNLDELKDVVDFPQSDYLNSLNYIGSLMDRLPLGFIIITSGNFTKSGFHTNMEIGMSNHRSSELSEYIKLFNKIKCNCAVSQEELTQEQEFQVAIQTLSSGVFYHDWDRSFDLRFRLKLSQKEIERLQKESLEKNKERYGEYTPEERKSISLNPINFQSIFEQIPQPIPSSIWRIYSIETILGQWVPRKISELIEEEINQSITLYSQMIQELTTPEKMDEYENKLKQDVKKFIEKEIIKADSDNLSAISSWKEKIKKICNNADILKIFISSYEKIDISLQDLDRKTILEIFKRIKSFTNINNFNRGVAKTWENLEIKKNTYYDNLFDKHLQQVEDLLEKNRIDDINKIKPEEEFFVTQKKGNTLIHGVYIKRDFNKIIYRDKLTGREESLIIKEIRTFKIKKQINNS